MIRTVRQTATQIASTSPFTRYAWVRDWCLGAAQITAQRQVYAAQWRRNNEMVASGQGPLWVALGDSTAQGLGAHSFMGGYVGQTREALVRATGQPWRIINISRSGATAKEVLRMQLPALRALAANADLITCGVGANDIITTPAAQLHATMRDLIAALPEAALVLDLPLPVRWWGAIGRRYCQHVSEVNDTIYATAQRHNIGVARVSQYFTPPWGGLFSADHFHPSETGYSAWTRAVLAAIDALHAITHHTPQSNWSPNTSIEGR